MKRRYVFITIALGAIIASFAYPLVTLLLAIQVEGYSHLRDHISELGLVTLPYAWVLNTVLIGNAVLVIGLAFAVQRSIGRPDQNRWAAILIATFGVALLIGGLFPCDLNCRPTTFHGWMHTINLLPSAVATIGAPFLMQRKFAEDPRLNLFSSVSFILGVLVIVFVLLAMTLFPVLDLEGLGQRLVLSLQLSFFVLVASAVVHVSLNDQAVVS